MLSFIFATHNKHKAMEINAILGSDFHIVTLEEAGIDAEIEEPFATLEENAQEKARFIYDLTKKDCFGEDTGLEITALKGAPGVKSARYAGEQRSSYENMQKVLQEMAIMKDRSARFRTIISLNQGGKYYLFEGICQGIIIASPRGEGGFGYDPIFVPDGSHKTFGEMNMEEKNGFSHRKKAVDKLIQFLKKQ